MAAATGQLVCPRCNRSSLSADKAAAGFARKACQAWATSYTVETEALVESRRLSLLLRHAGKPETRTGKIPKVIAEAQEAAAIAKRRRTQINDVHSTHFIVPRVIDLRRTSLPEYHNVKVYLNKPGHSLYRVTPSGQYACLMIKVATHPVYREGPDVIMWENEAEALAFTFYTSAEADHFLQCIASIPKLFPHMPEAAADQAATPIDLTLDDLTAQAAAVPLISGIDDSDPESIHSSPVQAPADQRPAAASDPAADDFSLTQELSAILDEEESPTAASADPSAAEAPVPPSEDDLIYAGLIRGSTGFGGHPPSVDMGASSVEVNHPRTLDFVEEPVAKQPRLSSPSGSSSPPPEGMGSSSSDSPPTMVYAVAVQAPPSFYLPPRSQSGAPYGTGI